MIARLIWYLYGLRKNLRLENARLQAMQLKRLKAVIRHAYENVPFYHMKFDKAGIKPNDFRSIEDLSKIPITTKSEILASSLENIVARNFDIAKCVKRTTSGSTGMPLTIVVNKNQIDFEEAVWNRSLLENGLKVKDKMAVISDPRSFPRRKNWFQQLGIMRREYISIFDDAKKQLSLLKKYKPDVVKGYPSSLAILADAEKRNVDGVEPRLIFTTAELLDKASRKLINSVYKTELIDNYACYEFGLLAWECHEHMGYHINMDSAVMEFARNGETVASGERGEIVCTGLANYAMPLIRYKIGDVGIPIKEHCACGVSLPLMKVLEGRLDDFLTTLDGRIVSPTIFFPYPFESFRGIRQFRVIQERRDRLVIQLSVKESFDVHTLDKAKREIQKFFGEGMQVEFQILEKIERDPTGKLGKIISHIPVNIV